MARIVDLDELLGGIVEVKLGGDVYKLPDDIPAELWLKITSVGQQVRDGEISDNQEILNLLYGQILELFQVYQPDIESLPLGVRRMVEVIPAIYGNRETKAGEGDARPTTPKTRGGSSSRQSSGKPAAKRSR